MKAFLVMPKAAKLLSQLSLIGCAYFVGIVAVLHILRPDYNPISRTISEYAIGSYGFLMASGFVALGLGSAALVLALIQGVPASGHSRVGLMLLTLWSTCVLLLSIFPTDLYGIPVSRSGIIHSLSAIVALISLLFASLLCSLRFRYTMQLRPFIRSSLTLTLIMFLTFTTFLASPVAFKGITERFLLFVDVVWLSWVALKLRSLLPVPDLD